MSHAQTGPAIASWRRIASRMGSAAACRRTISGSGSRFMSASVLTTIYLDKYQYSLPKHTEVRPMTAPIHEVVRDHYARAALAVVQSGCNTENPDCCGTINYSADELAELPGAAALASLGCGNPIAVAELH